LEINEQAIKQYIINYGNKSELARKTGLSRNTLYRIMGGSRRPGRKVIERVGEYLPMDKLFTGGDIKC